MYELIILVIILILLLRNNKIEHYQEKNNIEILKKTFKDVINYLNEENVIYWADYGTLLGFIREKDFIKWDYDVDFSVYYSKENMVKLHKVIAMMYSSGNWETSKAQVHKWYQIKHKKTGIHVDFYIWHLDNKGKLCPGFSYDAGKSLRLNKHISCTIYQDFYPTDTGKIFPLKSIIIDGYQVKIPNNSVQRLVDIYDEWWIPVRN